LPFIRLAGPELRSFHPFCLDLLLMAVKAGWTTWRRCGGRRFNSYFDLWWRSEIHVSRIQSTRVDWDRKVIVPSRWPSSAALSLSRHSFFLS